MSARAFDPRDHELEPVELRPVDDAAAAPEPLVRELPPSAPYPVEALGPLREVVEAVRGATQAPVAIPAASALAVASLVTQGHADVETLAGRSPVSLYILTVASSGQRKTTCDAALLAPLQDYEKERARAHRAAYTRWTNEHATWRARRDRILATLKKKDAKAEDVEAELARLGPEPAAPPSEDRVCTEPTFEGLVRFFVTGQPSAGLFSDEGGQFLGGHAMNAENRQKTLAALNALWMGDPIRRTRAGDGHYTLYGRRLALHLMVQPLAAATLLSDPLAVDMGFLARCLIAEPPSTIGTRLHAHVRSDPEALAAYAARLRAILGAPLPMDPETRELRPRLLRLSEPARRLLIEYSDTVDKLQAPGGRLEHVTAAASKSAEQAARIAGVLTMWRDLQAEEVDLADMARGIELAQYYLSEAVRLSDAATVSVDVERAERLRRWLLESWPHPEVLLADVVRRAPIRALRESPAARRALDLLEGHGWLEPLEPGVVVRGKPRKRAWRIVRPTGGGSAP